MMFQVQTGAVEAVPEGGQPVDQDLDQNGWTRLSLSAVHDIHQRQADLLCGIPGESNCLPLLTSTSHFSQCVPEEESDVG